MEIRTCVGKSGLLFTLIRCGFRGFFMNMYCWRIVNNHGRLVSVANNKSDKKFKAFGAQCTTQILSLSSVNEREHMHDQLMLVVHLIPKWWLSQTIWVE